MVETAPEYSGVTPPRVLLWFGPAATGVKAYGRVYASDRTRGRRAVPEGVQGGIATHWRPMEL